MVDFLVATEGALVSWLEVDDFGRVHADTLAAAIAENPADVAVVTVMWANNEVGTVNPIRELAEVAQRARHPVPHRRGAGARPAAGRLRRSGADALTVTGHKVGGPTGIGVAAAAPRDRTSCRCCTAVARSAASGPGTLDVAGIVGLAVAVQDAVDPSRGAGRRCWPACATS